MSKAILTIDDAPTGITPQILDYLRAKGIIPVVNFIGAEVDRHFDEAVYAVKTGCTIGNHSFSHPHFSTLTLQECRDEIAKTELEIERVYAYAGMKREHKVFRFPYGDQGGAKYAQIQQILREEFHFDRLDDSQITFPWWKENHIDTAVDMRWSFDFIEYRLPWNDGYTWDSIVNRIHDANPEQGGRLIGEGITNIILMHDTEETNQYIEKYYEKLIDYVLSCGLEFTEPRFVPAV